MRQVAALALRLEVDMPLMYRVERNGYKPSGPGTDVFQRGAYGCEIYWRAFPSVENINRLYDTCHPNPCTDKKLRGFWRGDTDGYYFGFESIQQLRQWFFDAEGRAVCTEVDAAVISVYYVNPDKVSRKHFNGNVQYRRSYYHGERQMVAHYQRCTRVVTWPLNTECERVRFADVKKALEAV